ncbi:hypothetical protein ACFE04_011299 [Oxalis oulophora]
MAAKLAIGNKISMAIPILASVYDDLKSIISSPAVIELIVNFQIHYIFAWLASYFDTHDSTGHFPHHVSPLMVIFGGAFSPFLMKRRRWLKTEDDPGLQNWLKTDFRGGGLVSSLS